MYKLVLIRHGESTWNLENRFTGWTDVELTATGVAQARQIVERRDRGLRTLRTQNRRGGSEDKRQQRRQTAARVNTWKHDDRRARARCKETFKRWAAAGALL